MNYKPVSIAKRGHGLRGGGGIIIIIIITQELVIWAP
jgi:hypothetical protein